MRHPADARGEAGAAGGDPGVRRLLESKYAHFLAHGFEAARCSFFASLLPTRMSAESRGLTYVWSDCGTLLICLHGTPKQFFLCLHVPAVQFRKGWQKPPFAKTDGMTSDSFDCPRSFTRGLPAPLDSPGRVLDRDVYVRALVRTDIFLSTRARIRGAPSRAHSTAPLRLNAHTFRAHTR